MTRRYYTDNELQNILLDSGSDEDFVMPDPADYGWIDETDEDEPHVVSTRTNRTNDETNENAEISSELSSDSEQEVASKKRKTK